MVVGNIYAIAAVSVIGGGLFGFDISSMSAIISTPAYKCYFNHGPDGPPFNDSLTCSGLSSLAQGGVTASMPAGSWLGALISGFISDRLGRKYAIMSGCIVWYVTIFSPILYRATFDRSCSCLGLLVPLSSVLPRTWVC
jgi:MFS family permease